MGSLVGGGQVGGISAQTTTRRHGGPHRPGNVTALHGANRFCMGDQSRCSAESGLPDLRCREQGPTGRPLAEIALPTKYIVA